MKRFTKNENIEMFSESEEEMAMPSLNEAQSLLLQYISKPVDDPFNFEPENFVLPNTNIALESTTLREFFNIKRI